jgi:hypothetical protein
MLVFGLLFGGVSHRDEGAATPKRLIAVVGLTFLGSYGSDEHEQGGNDRADTEPFAHRRPPVYGEL